MGKWIHRERFEQLAARQHGRVTWSQLKRLGVLDSTIHRKIAAGYLLPVHPKVYAVGHRAPSRAADLWAAILYAGPGATLSHGTAAHWLGLIDHAPKRIEVSTPRQIASLPAVRVYGRRRHLPRQRYQPIPVTSPAQTLLDLAATSNLKLIRRALANLDYRHQFDLDALRAVCKPGRPGSRRLKQALAEHQPEFAHTNGPLEEQFLAFCERHRLPIPRLNSTIHGIKVDAHWPQHNLVVELDGYDNHSSPAQLNKDKRNDLILRSHGITVHRYDWALLHRAPENVYEDITTALAARVSSRSVT